MASGDGYETDHPALNGLTSRKSVCSDTTVFLLGVATPTAAVTSAC